METEICHLTCLISLVKKPQQPLLHKFPGPLNIIKRHTGIMHPDIMHCMFSLAQTHALGGSKHGLCIDD